MDTVREAGGAVRASGEAPAAEKPDNYAVRALVASTVGYAMDGFDQIIIGFLLVPLSAELHLLPAQTGSIVTLTLLGAVLGGIIFGVLSDRFGRVRVLSWTILLFAICTGLCALSRGYWDLLTYRVLAGLGLGGEWGIGMALVTEACPPSMRARFSSMVSIGGTVGIASAAFLTPVLLPAIGWRGMFAVGILPALVAFMLRRVLHEPRIFVERIQQQPAPRPLPLLFGSASKAKTSIAVIVLCGVQNFGFYGLMIWLPTYLSTRFGYSLTKSAVWTGVTALGMMAGIWLFGELADRIGRRPAFFLYQIGAALMVLIYPHFSSPGVLLVGGAVMGLFVNGMLGGYGTLIAELYPTEVRGTAQNVLYNIGRAIGGFGPLTIAVLAAKYSFGIAIACLALIYVLDFVVTATLIPERRGMALE
jgi:MFS family permease